MPSFPLEFSKWTRGYWSRLWERIHREDDYKSEIETTFREVSSRLPIPVIWLLGKTQSGKSSIVRALTESTAAEVGNGFQPCTKTSRMYHFPSEDDCLIRFLDTRGLGETEYDPSEDIELFAQQSHLLIVVLKGMDHAQEGVFSSLKEIYRRHPEWPVLVVQTCLHEGYPTRETNHVEPYPYQDVPWNESIPSDLRRSLLHQRQTIEGLGVRARFVAIDFTQPEDGYAPAEYGIDALWEGIEELLPLGLRGMLTAQDDLQDAFRDVCFREAHRLIMSHSLAAGGVALVPVPMVDLPAVLAVQARMCQRIAGVYHHALDTRGVAELFGTLGTGIFLRMGGRELLKLVPGAGSAVASLYAAGTTYALGLTLSAYFSRLRDGAIPNPEEFREMYKRYSRIGQERMRDYLRRSQTEEQTAPTEEPEGS